MSIEKIGACNQKKLIRLSYLAYEASIIQAVVSQ